MITHDGTQYGIQLELTPSGARTLLGMPAGALGPSVVGLEELLGRSAAVLPERLREQRGWPRRFALLEEILLDRLTSVGGAAVPAELDACGYADQSHLTREWNRFAGCSPTAWVSGEQLPFVQDGTLADTSG